MQNYATFKSDAATFEVNMTNHSQDITKRQFEQKMTVSPHKKTLLYNMKMEEKCFTFCSRRNSR